MKLALLLWTAILITALLGYDYTCGLLCMGAILNAR